MYPKVFRLPRLLEHSVTFTESTISTFISIYKVIANNAVSAKFTEACIFFIDDYGELEAAPWPS
jgi:hypothetical protein